MKRLILILLLISSFSIYAAGNCKGRELVEAQKKVSTLIKSIKTVKHPWQSLQKSFKNNLDCMNVNEAYDLGEAIRYIFFWRWDALSDLSEFKKQDTKFYQFVFSGLADETALSEDLNNILVSAQSKCPKGQEVICNDIKKIILLNPILKSKP
jgi:hypothetical protein